MVAVLCKSACCAEVETAHEHDDRILPYVLNVLTTTGMNIYGSSGLALPGLDSAGSSVFDLPIQNAPNPLQNIAAAESEQSPPSNYPDHRDTTSISFLIISGGTGGNAICSAFTNACYILPVSDDGGSSSEIIRVLGGPSIGMLSIS